MTTGGDAGELIDLDRLTDDERQLWDEFFAESLRPTRSAVDLWAFGYACMLLLTGVPEVVQERLHELDPEGAINQYQDNLRRARWARGG